MLALEKCPVIVGCGSGACFSVLSGKRHQGRTVRRDEKQLVARLLVRDAYSSIPLYGLRSPIIPVHETTTLIGESMSLSKPGRVCSPTRWAALKFDSRIRVRAARLFFATEIAATDALPRSRGYDSRQSPETSSSRTCWVSLGNEGCRLHDRVHDHRSVISYYR